jgi:cell division protease FtsH
MAAFGGQLRARWKRLGHDLADFNRKRRRNGWIFPVKLSSPNTRQFILLFATLVGLIGAFFYTNRLNAPVTDGAEVSFTRLTALSKNCQIATAVLYDFDKRVVGKYLTVPPAQVVPAPPPSSGVQVQPPAPPTTPTCQAALSTVLTANQAAAAAAKATPGKTAPAGGTPSTNPPPAVKPVPVVSFWSDYAQTDAATPLLIAQLVQGGADARMHHQPAKVVVQFTAQYLLPLVILANLFALIFVSSRAGGSDALSGVIQFGRIGKKRSRQGGEALTTFSDVAGLDEQITELQEVRDYLVDPERFAAMGAQPPKGVLLFGPPGCGKTLMARAVAGEAGVPFFSISGAEFVESLVGVGAARVRDLFRTVRSVAPAIIFIDELDAAGRRRGGASGGQEEREQTLNQLLVEMDGFEPTSGIVVIGATNRPDILDPALMRPGRFDRQVTVEPPDLAGREEILRLHARRRPVSADVDFENLARRTPGFTGADLANVINEGALLAVRFGSQEIGNEELEEAVQRVLVGPRRRGHLMTSDERRRAAVHESGHAVLAAAVGRLTEIQRISIITRGRTVGQATSSKGWQERVLLTKSELRGEMMIVIAGVAAEELLLGEPSTGSESDLDRATALAEVMVGRYGMSEELGKVRLLQPDGGEFLGRDVVASELTAGPVLMDGAQMSATEYLRRHREALESVIDRLLDEETLESSQLEQLLESVQPEMNLVTPVVEETAATNGHSRKRVTVRGDTD